MPANPLKKNIDPAFDRSKWTLQEHCEHANAQLILNEGNETRRKRGLPPVRWVIRDGRVVIENAPAEVRYLSAKSTA